MQVEGTDQSVPPEIRTGDEDEGRMRQTRWRGRRTRNKDKHPFSLDIRCYMQQAGKLTSSPGLLG
jgi:hypothetical protein